MTRKVEQKEQFMSTKIGIDFGGVIRCDDGNPHDHAFRTIQHIVHKYGRGHCYIISKAGPQMEGNILQWLDDHNFTEVTGFDPYNIYFVRDYAAKRTVVDRLSINIFIDDKIKNIKAVIGAESIRKVIWFNNKSNCKFVENTRQSTHYGAHKIPKHLRNILVILADWNRVQKALGKCPKTHVKVRKK